MDINAELKGYNFEDHLHKFAAWSGATAGSSSKLCRFKVKTGKEILEQSGIHPQGELKYLLQHGKYNCHRWYKEICKNNFDKWHSNICNRMIGIAQNLTVSGFTFGVAAKILNCYLKSYINQESGVLGYIHPPIDRILLTMLAKENVGNYKSEWIKLRNIGWSKFNEKQYSYCLELIRVSLKNEPLWKIEYYWQGHQ